MHLLDFGKVPRLRGKPPGLRAKQGILYFSPLVTVAPQNYSNGLTHELSHKQENWVQTSVLPGLWAAPVEACGGLFQYLGQLQ